MGIELAPLTVPAPSPDAFRMVHVPPNPPPNAVRIIYLLHFSARTRENRQHYLGWTRALDRRYAQHRSRRGCRETSKAVADGLKLTVAQTWTGTPTLEKQLKAWSKAGRRGYSGICPLCEGNAALPVDLARELGAPSMKLVGRIPVVSAESAAPGN